MAYRLRFEDLLRVEDWDVKNCTYSYGEVCFLYGTNKAVVHRFSGMDLWVVPVNGVIWNSPQFSETIINGFTRSKRRRLSEFAREVIRHWALKSALLAERENGGGSVKPPQIKR